MPCFLCVCIHVYNAIIKLWEELVSDEVQQ